MLDCSFYEWIIESINEIIFPLMNLLVRWRRERFTWFDCKILQNGKPVTMELHWQKHGRPVQRNHSYPV